MKILIVLALTTLMCGSAIAAERSDPKKTVLLWYEAFDGNKPALLDDLLDPSWIDIPSPPSEHTGPAAAKAFARRFRTSR